jgi:hypothetical protein
MKEKNGRQKIVSMDEKSLPGEHTQSCPIILLIRQQ